MQLFFCPSIPNGDFFLNPEESRHCAKVLRKKAGEQIDISDGVGNFYNAELTIVNYKKCYFKILSSRATNLPKYSIHIAIAPTKNTDRIDWFIEKSVEIGINKISFIQTTYSERKSINMDRINRKAISAMKQSIRSYLPEIYSVKKLPIFLDSIGDDYKKFVAHFEGSQTPNIEQIATPNSNILVLIGPEGGFTKEEISLATEKKFKLVKIGDYRLRTETSGIVVCTILNSINYEI